MTKHLANYEIVEVNLMDQTAVTALVEITQDADKFVAFIHFGLETEEHVAESLDELDFYIHSATPGFLRVDLVSFDGDLDVSAN